MVSHHDRSLLFVVVVPSFICFANKANERTKERIRRTTYSRPHRSFKLLNDNDNNYSVQCVLFLLPLFFASFVLCSMRKDDHLAGRIRRSATTSPRKETTTTYNSLSNSHVHAYRALVCCVFTFVSVLLY